MEPGTAWGLETEGKSAQIRPRRGAGDTRQLARRRVRGAGSAEPRCPLCATPYQNERQTSQCGVWGFSGRSGQ